MNSLTRIMSYDKTKIKNQENCNCEECVSVGNAESDNQITEYPKTKIRKRKFLLEKH